MASTAKITLGRHTFTAVQQSYPYLTHHLPPVVAGIAGSMDGGDVEGLDLISFLGDGVYDVLLVFLPKGLLEKPLPRWEFHGYPNRQAWENGEYDEETAEAAPTVTDIIEALNTLIELNGGAYLKRLFGWLDPKPIRAAISIRIGEAIIGTETEEDSPSMISPSSPSTNGDSVSMSASETPPTPTPNGSASLSHA